MREGVLGPARSRRVGAATPKRAASQASASAASANSGGAHSPPQMPLRRASLEQHTPVREQRNSMCVRFAGAAARGGARRAAPLGARPRMRAQPSASGQRSQAGLARVQTRRAEIHDRLRVVGDARRAACRPPTAPRASSGPPTNPAASSTRKRARARASRCRRGSRGAGRTRARGSRPPWSGRCRAARSTRRGSPAARRRAARRFPAPRDAGCAHARSSRAPTTARITSSCGARGERGDVGKARHEALEVRHHRLDLRLLQHDFRDPDAVGRRVAARAGRAGRARRTRAAASRRACPARDSRRVLAVRLDADHGVAHPGAGNARLPDPDFCVDVELRELARRALRASPSWVRRMGLAAGFAAAAGSD